LVAELLKSIFSLNHVFFTSFEDYEMIFKIRSMFRYYVIVYIRIYV